MEKEAHKYTSSELDAMTVHDLRIALSKLGGTPMLKNRREMMDEITNIQLGNIIPQRSNRGRKPKFKKAEAMLAKKEEEEKKEKQEQQAVSPFNSNFNEYPPFLREQAPYRSNYYPDYQINYRGINKHNQQEPLSRYGSQQYINRSPYVEQRDMDFAVSDIDNCEEKSVVACGVLDIADGHGFLRTLDLHKSMPDYYVDRQIIRKYDLMSGDYIIGYALDNFEKKSFVLKEVLKINDINVGEFKRPTLFENRAAVYPRERLNIGSEANDFALRAIDLFVPLAKGQRGLITAPARMGKTTLLKRLAFEIEKNFPEIKLMVLLIAERPEEITDFVYMFKDAEIMASSFDDLPDKQVMLAELCLENAKRQVECGKDVILLCDSITKLAKAYHGLMPMTQKGLLEFNVQAVGAAKRFFGCARNTQEGGSLTIISLANVKSGNEVDDMIYMSLRENCNFEVVLSEPKPEYDVFPVVDLSKSGTRNEEILYSEDNFTTVRKIKNKLLQSDNPFSIFVTTAQNTSSNKELLDKSEVFFKN